MTFFLLSSVAKILVVFTVIMVSVAMLTLIERRVCAWMQDRLGPNRVGPFGIFQPLADGVKNIMKEETYPALADRVLFVLAPCAAFVPALLTFAVIPFGAPLPTPWGDVPLVVADLPIGFLYILALSSLGVYGIVLAGWSSNNKYALLGGLRATAQMISYEIAMGMSTVAVLLLAGNVAMSEIVARQSASVIQWNVFPLGLAWFIFLVAAFAETNRLPFDLPEAEGELIAGYHTEYSSMKFSMFYIAEYSNMVTASALMVTLFFGGWDVPFTQWDNTAPWTLPKTLVTVASFTAKMCLFLFLYIWVRWTLPRFRYDQLMALGWKIMLPLALAYLTVVATAIWYLHAVRGWEYDARFAAVLFGLNVVLALILFVGVDRGRIVSGAWSAPEGVMAIGVKRMTRPTQQTSYVRATLSGLALTFKHLLQPKVTMQYPEEKSAPDWTLSGRWRGTHRMLTDEAGRAKCVACGLCPQICPANCIKLVPGEDEQGNRYPLIYEIDEFRCVFCGYCQEVCPEEAIHVGVHYENAEFSRDRFVYDLERLCAQTHPVSTLWDPSDPRGE